jgi:RNA polymerase sigma factor (TIGR02999 family)
MNEVTRLLRAVAGEDRQAAEELLPLVYQELRKLAAQRLSQEKPGQTLQATALVHEAYLRLVDVSNSQNWNGRGHFFAAAAEAMRRILIENARRKQRVKHGGQHDRVELDQLQIASPDALVSPVDLLALDDALTRLGQQGGAREASLLRWPDAPGSCRRAGTLPRHSRPLLGLRPRLALPRAFRMLI